MLVLTVACGVELSEAPFVAHWFLSKATLRKPLRDGVEQVWPLPSE